MRFPPIPIRPLALCTQAFQVSISPTFYEQLLRQNSFHRKITKPNCKHLIAVQKPACKILVKLTVIPKFFAQLLSAYNLFCNFLAKGILAQKLLIKCW
jgi:hypothetical protein